MPRKIQATYTNGRRLSADPCWLFRLSTNSAVDDIIDSDTGEVLYARNYNGKPWFSNLAVAMIMGE